jgi:hypothetical protein
MKNLIKITCVIALGIAMAVISISAINSSADYAVYYVDSFEGNDNNSGTSANAAWKSLDKVNSMIFKPGDSILFKANCSWTGTLEPKGSGDDARQITISMYGYDSAPRHTRNKPHIEGNGAYAAVMIKDVEYWTVSNLDVTNRSSTAEIKLRNGIVAMARPEGITHRIIIQDCTVREVDGDYRRRVGMYKNSGIRVTFPGRSSAENRYDEVLIQRNHVHDVKTNGIYVVSEADAHLETYYTNVRIANNTIIRTGADGIIISHCIDPVVEHNQILDAGFHGNYLSTSLIAGCWGDNNDGVIIFQNNEVARTRKFQGDGQAFDTDWGTGGVSIFQYNYSHENEGGFHLNCPSIRPSPNYIKTVLRYNLSVNDEHLIIHHDNNYLVEVYNNVFYKTAGNLHPGTSKAYKFWNNIFHFTTEPDWGPCEYNNNLYYPIAANPSDPNGISANPNFVRAGATGDGWHYTEFYKIRENSPCIDAGIPIADNGSKDFYGNPLYNGLPDIGAMEFVKPVIDIKKD